MALQLDTQYVSRMLEDGADSAHHIHVAKARIVLGKTESRSLTGRPSDTLHKL